MIYIVDTYAWIEYLIGSSKGAFFKKLLDNINNKFITMDCCIAEIYGYCLKNNLDFDKIYRVIKSNSIILPIMIDTWINAAKARFELRKKISNFGLIDSILVAEQKDLKCKIVSGDYHFKNLPNVAYLN